MNLLSQYVSLLRPYRTRVSWAITVGGFAALFEGVALAALLPVLTSDGLDNQKVAAWIALPTTLITTENRLTFSLLAFVILGCFACYFRYAAEALTLEIKTRIEKQARNDMTDALLNMSWTRFMHLNQGDIGKALVVEGLQIATGVQHLITAMAAAIAGACYFGVAMVVSPPIALMATLFGGACYGIHRVVSRKTHHAAQHLSRLSSEIGEASATIFGNLKYFRSTGFESVAQTRARDIFDGFADAYYKANIQPQASRGVIEGLAAVFIACFLYAQLFVFGGSTVEALVALAIFYRMAPKLLTVQNSLLHSLSLVSWLNSYRSRLDQALLHKDPPTTADQKANFTQVIQLQGLRYDYPETQSPAIHGVSIDIHKGEHVALVGASGSGKSTLVDLVTGLLTPTGGAILVDGHRLDACDTRAWRHQIGLVMQDSFLLNDTVAANVSFGALQPDAQRVIECLKLANAWEFVSGFAAGIDERIAERGARLSGGQRQRLSIARALYHRPSLLILDEATSALDTQAEMEFQKAIIGLQGSLTIISIAHRLQTVRAADKLYVMRQGTVVESGTWDALMRRDGELAALARSN